MNVHMILSSTQERDSTILYPLVLYQLEMERFPVKGEGGFFKTELQHHIKPKKVDQHLIPTHFRFTCQP
jgi:hypothetical protein